MSPSRTSQLCRYYGGRVVWVMLTVPFALAYAGLARVTGVVRRGRRALTRVGGRAAGPPDTTTSPRPWSVSSDQEPMWTPSLRR